MPQALADLAEPGSSAWHRQRTRHITTAQVRKQMADALLGRPGCRALDATGDVPRRPVRPGMRSGGYLASCRPLATIQAAERPARTSRPRGPPAAASGADGG